MSTNSKLLACGNALAKIPLLTLADLASHYDCTERQIRRMVQRGAIARPCYPKGSKSPRWHALDILRRDLAGSEP